MDQMAAPIDKGEQLRASVEKTEASADKPVSVENVGECSAAIETVREVGRQSTTVENAEVVKEQSSSTGKGDEIRQKDKFLDNMETAPKLSTSKVSAAVDEASPLLERPPGSGRYRDPITYHSSQIYIFSILAILTWLLAVCYIYYGSMTYDKGDNTYLIGAGGILFFTGLFFSLTMMYMWGCVPIPRARSSGQRRNRRVESRSNSRSGSQPDIENQVASADANETQITGPSSDQVKVEKDDDCSTAEEKQHILPASSEVSAGSTISEIASVISQIASDAMVSEESNQAREPVQSLASSQEQDEGLSSGELRRRKFPNPEDYKDLTASSDEELTKNE